MNAHPTNPSSPFHEGEMAAQARAGKRESAETYGKVGIRDFMPDQHRAFFEHLPFVVMGSVDPQGWPWASILVGRQGFMTSPTNRRLDLAAIPLADDPLNKAFTTGAAIGLLGIELSTRRRNRMNARVAAAGSGGLSLDVVQSFGNCPQYIQTRDVEFIRAPDAYVDRAETETFTTLDGKAQAFIRAADTFFVASSAVSGLAETAPEVDVSHRGGKAGFVRVDGNTLTVPDFSGNNFFNTIGNFMLNSRAGLLFPDFESGDLLMLTGEVELLWEDHPDILAFKGAERGWKFTLDHGMRMHDALPFRARFESWSPNSLMADDWQTVEARKKAEAERASWRRLRVSAIKDESSLVRSFTFEPLDDTPLLSFEAGQFLTLRVDVPGVGPQVRTYTVSSAPGESAYRISVKKEADGVVSNHLHDTLQVDDIVEVKAPRGAFFLDPSERRPAVLIAGGVGVTPMMSMVQHVLHEGVRKRYIRPLTVFHAARRTDQRAFHDDLRAAAIGSNGGIRYVSLISAPAEGEKAGVDFDLAGRISGDVLKAWLALDDYDFYICGPGSFMQSVYNDLRALGVRDARIKAEAFGPAALTRKPDAGVESKVLPPEAETATVAFKASEKEYEWTQADGSLLETAEAQGLSPAFSCRSGTCGSCLTRKLSGTVTYRTPVAADHDEDNVLICCAVPARSSEKLVLEL